MDGCNTDIFKRVKQGKHEKVHCTVVLHKSNLQEYLLHDQKDIHRRKNKYTESKRPLTTVILISNERTQKEITKMQRECQMAFVGKYFCFRHPKHDYIQFMKLEHTVDQ